MNPDGGPVYPCKRIERNSLWKEGETLIPRMVDVSYSGMSLRDYFAAQALTGAFKGGDTDVDDHIMARRCYQIADAMLAERAKGQTDAS